MRAACWSPRKSSGSSSPRSVYSSYSTAWYQPGARRLEGTEWRGVTLSEGRATASRRADRITTGEPPPTPRSPLEPSQDSRALVQPPNPFVSRRPSVRRGTTTPGADAVETTASTSSAGGEMQHGWRSYIPAGVPGARARARRRIGGQVVAVCSEAGSGADARHRQRRIVHRARSE